MDKLHIGIRTEYHTAKIYLPIRRADGLEEVVKLTNFDHLRSTYEVRPVVELEALGRGGTTICGWMLATGGWKSRITGARMSEPCSTSCAKSE